MAEGLYRDPTFDHCVRAEIFEKKGCGCCTRRIEVMRGALVCSENKTYPLCKSHKKGFDYDEGE